MKLKELGVIITGNTPSKNKKEFYNSSDICFFKPSDLEEDKINYLESSEEYISENARDVARILPKDALLMTCIGTIGKIGVLKKEATCNQQINAIIPNELVIPEYLGYLLLSKKEYLKKKANAPVVPIINKTDFSSIDVNICDIEEQKNIVVKLNKINELILLRKKEIEKCNGLIKSQFVEMLYLNPSANKLGEFISRYKAERANDIDYPVLSITKEFGIVLQSEKFKKRIASDDTSSYKVVPYGKLVQGIHIDERNFAIQNKVDNGIVSPAYKIWNVDETKCNSEVLAYALRSDYVMNYIRSKFTGSIKRRENINYEDFMATPINLPKLEIQNEFYEKKKLIDKQKFVNLKIFQLLGKKLKK